MLYEIVIISSGIAFLAAMLGFFVRWLIVRRRRVKLPNRIIEEMNLYSVELRRIIRDMDRLFRNIEDHGRRRWRRKNLEIVHHLRQVNRLLQKLHGYLTEEAQLLEGEGPDGEISCENLTQRLKRERPVRRRGELGQRKPKIVRATDFSSREEMEKFRGMPDIAERETKDVDWDELERRLSSGI